MSIMSGVELIGLIAALPGLVELVKTAASTTKQLISYKTFRKETTDLLNQLVSIEAILHDILTKFKATSLSQDRTALLLSATTALKEDLVSLNNLLNTRASLKEGSKLLQRACLFASGFDRKIKQYRERLERTKSSLTLAIAEGERTFIVIIQFIWLILQRNPIHISDKHTP